MNYSKSRKKTCPPCPLCCTSATRTLVSVNGRDYRRCDQCEATFLNPKNRLSREEEYAQYLLHKNNTEDRRYRKFLSRLATPLLKRLVPGSSGLDYGCGPAPLLAAMLTEAGHNMRLFDPFFHPDQSVLNHTYDFITCTETIEHFHRPAREFSRLAGMLRPGGWMGVMTCFQTEDKLFSSWHYRRDPTHVIFYRETTLHHIAERSGLSCEIPTKDVALMQKPVYPKVIPPQEGWE
ncbi:MAG: class I SAM-dependent methyltransferase [Deltaproteobacteria bacterium]|nr:class I SAM-dependent methyltransferase [Deltaproteobacteria bacterium]